MTDKRTRTAFCKLCKKNTKYHSVGTPRFYIACEECGCVFWPVKAEQLGVRDELLGIYNLKIQTEKGGIGGT